MPHTQVDLRKAHHEVRRLLGEIARLRRQRKDINRRKRQGGSVTIEVLRHVLREAVEHRRRIRAQLTRSQAPNAELAPTLESQVLIPEPMGEFALAADAEGWVDLAATAANDQTGSEMTPSSGVSAPH